jgi:hypothetical protein
MNMEERESVAQGIMKYIDECTLDLVPIWPQDAFMHYSYSRWTAEEMLAYILDFPFDPPIDVLEDFIIKLTYYSCAAKDENARLLFATAAATAEDIVSYISHTC